MIHSLPLRWALGGGYHVNTCVYTYALTVNVTIYFFIYTFKGVKVVGDQSRGRRCSKRLYENQQVLRKVLNRLRNQVTRIYLGKMHHHNLTRPYCNLDPYRIGGIRKKIQLGKVFLKLSSNLPAEIPTSEVNLFSWRNWWNGWESGNFTTKFLSRPNQSKCVMCVCFTHCHVGHGRHGPIHGTPGGLHQTIRHRFYFLVIQFWDTPNVGTGNTFWIFGM